MNQFPRMLYKCPGPMIYEGGNFSTRIVADQDEQDAAHDDGWRTSTTEAKADDQAARTGQTNATPAVPEVAPEAPEYTELKAKADALGLVWKDVPIDTLLARVAALSAPPATPDVPAAPAEEVDLSVIEDEEAYKAEREELKTAAAGMGLVYPRNASNQKLRDLIAAQQAAAPGA